MSKENEKLLLGQYIKKEMKELEKQLNKKLNLNKSSDDFVEVNYSFKLNQGKIDDTFIVDVFTYDNEDNEQNLTFKFKSLDIIFLDQIIKVINDTIENPANFRKSYYENSGFYYLELLNDIEQNSFDLED